MLRSTPWAQQWQQRRDKSARGEITAHSAVGCGGSSGAGGVVRTGGMLAALHRAVSPVQYSAAQYSTVQCSQHRAEQPGHDPFPVVQWSGE